MNDRGDEHALGATEQNAAAGQAPPLGPRRLRPGCGGCLILLVIVILLFVIYPHAIFFFWMAPG